VRSASVPKLEALEDRTLPSITAVTTQLAMYVPDGNPGFGWSENKMWWTTNHDLDEPGVNSRTEGIVPARQPLRAVQSVRYTLTGAELALVQQPVGLAVSEYLGFYRYNPTATADRLNASTAALTFQPGRLPGTPASWNQVVNYAPDGFTVALSGSALSNQDFNVASRTRSISSSQYLELSKTDRTTSLNGNRNMANRPAETAGITYAAGWAALPAPPPSSRFHVYTVSASADASTLTVSLGNTTGYTLQYASDSTLTDTPDGSGVTWADASLTNVVPDANGVFDAGTDSPTWWGLSDGSPSDPGIVLSAASFSNAPLVPAGTTPITEPASTIGGGPIATWLFFQTPTGPASLLVTVTPTPDQQQGGGTAPSPPGAGGGRGGLAALDAGLGVALARAEATTGQLTFGVSDPASTARGPSVIQAGVGASPSQHDPVSTTSRAFRLSAGDHLSGTDTAVGDALFGLPDGYARDFGVEHSGS
jgi:hypothetical protein